MKGLSRTAAISLCFLGVCGITNTCANAQSSTSTPQPSAEIQSLTKALTGTWSLIVTFEPIASAANGITNTGEETWRAGPGGFTLLEEERLRMPKEEVFLLGIIWWNAVTKSFQGMECQNALPYTCDVKGSLTDITISWDGKQFIIDELETHNGKKTTWHEVWSDITPTSFTQTGESSEPGAPRKRLFTIHAARVTPTHDNNDIHGTNSGNDSAVNSTDQAPKLAESRKSLVKNRLQEKDFKELWQHP